MPTFLQLAKNAFRECLREPVFFLILAGAVLLIGFFPAFTLFVFRRQLSMVVDSSLALTLLFGFIAAALCSTRCIRREITGGTALLLLSKPVTRFGYICAKMIGVNAALMVFALICSAAAVTASLVACDPFKFDIPGMLFFFITLGAACVFGALRNYFARASFTSNAIAGMAVLLPLYALLLYARVKGGMDEATLNDPLSFLPFLNFLPALLLIFAALWTMGAISSALAVSIPFIANLLISLTLFIAGLLSGYLVKAVFGGETFLASLAAALLPNWQYFWMADALAERTPIPGSYVLWAGVYALMYSAVWSVWAAAVFRNQEPAGEIRP